MKPESKDNDDLRPEYYPEDFPNAFERGKYAKRSAEASNVVVISPDLTEHFPNQEAVNNALRSLVEKSGEKSQ